MNRFRERFGFVWYHHGLGRIGNLQVLNDQLAMTEIWIRGSGVAEFIQQCSGKFVRARGDFASYFINVRASHEE